MLFLVCLEWLDVSWMAEVTVKTVEQNIVEHALYLKQSKEFTFSARNETFRIKHLMSCTLTNLIHVITSAGCGQNYIGEMGDVLRNRVMVHKQQIRDPSTRMLGVSKHIDECLVGSTHSFLCFCSTRFLVHQKT